MHIATALVFQLTSSIEPIINGTFVLPSFSRITIFWGDGVSYLHAMLGMNTALSFGIGTEFAKQ